MVYILGRQPKQSSNGKYFLDLAVGGQTILKLLRRAKCIPKTCYPWFCGDIVERHIVIMIRTKDILHKTSPSQLKSQYSHLFRFLLSLNPKGIQICTIPPCKNFESVNEINHYIRRFCAEKQINCTDIEAIVNRTMMEGDGIYLNEQGLETVWNAVASNYNHILNPLHNLIISKTDH
nr:uncharacterized protein LOC111429034 [Onthophagus taurus]